MHLAEELTLLVKSKYPLVYLETSDEDYALEQLREIAGRLRLLFFQWSVSGGLRRADSKGSFYQTSRPATMLKTLIELAGPAGGRPGLYVLKDFHRHWDDDVVRRLFKDVILQIRDTPDTVVILAPEYRLPADLESYTGHIVGGYPDEREIAAQLTGIIDEVVRSDRRLRIALTGEESSRVVRALRGLTLQQIRNVVSRAILQDGRLDLGDLALIDEYKRKAFDREGLLEFHGAAPSDEIAGFPNLQAWLAERSDCFAGSAPPGLPPPRGVLLLGVQGCGKSLAVKVIAGKFDLPLYQLDPGRLYGKYIGETEENLRKALGVAERLAPLCLWIDEIEKGFAVSDGRADGGVSQRVLGTFLPWMQERKAKCFIAATANDIQRLPPEFLRKGRFDEIFFADLPDARTREAIFRIHLRKRNLNPEEFDPAALAARAVDFSGAEIEQVIISALYGAAHRGEPISTGHLLDRIAAAKPLAILKREEIESLRAWAVGRTVKA